MIYKKLIQNQQEKQYENFENKSDNILMANIKHTFIVKLLTNAAVVSIVTLYLEHVKHFHI